jgi:hypothetical protein
LVAVATLLTSIWESKAKVKVQKSKGKTGRAAGRESGPCIAKPQFLAFLGNILRGM